MAASAHHKHLVSQGAKWLKQRGFSVVATEITAAGSREQPDVVGFRAACSVIIEVKVSRADFLADAKKQSRTIHSAGLGNYRFYLCPDGLIHPSELPSKWGLLYACGTKIIDQVSPAGNMWPSGDVPHDILGEWSAFLHASNLAKERAILFSIARRLAAAKQP